MADFVFLKPQGWSPTCRLQLYGPLSGTSARSTGGAGGAGAGAGGGAGGATGGGGGGATGGATTEAPKSLK